MNLQEILGLTPKLNELLWVDMAQKTAPFRQTPTWMDFGWGVSVDARNFMGAGTVSKGYNIAKADQLVWSIDQSKTMLASLLKSPGTKRMADRMRKKIYLETQQLLKLQK